MMIKFSLGCRCGMTMTSAAATTAAFDDIAQLWRKAHTGPNCAPCDTRTAGRIRRANERKALTAPPKADPPQQGELDDGLCRTCGALICDCPLTQGEGG